VRIAGIVLIILGVVGLVYGGITYTRRRDTVSIGPITATVNQRETFPISPIAGAVALVAGDWTILGGQSSPGLRRHANRGLACRCSCRGLLRRRWG
jgi:hypothetical protein